MEKKSDRRLIEALGFEKREGDNAQSETERTGQRSGKKLREQLMDNKE